MSDQPEQVRSYQRIFTPQRRIYAIDGRTLPLPGGVSLRWLGMAIAALVGVILLAAHARVVVLAVGAVAGWIAVRLDRRRWTLGTAAAGVLVALLAGALLRLLDWPLRLLVVPALVATVATQVTPDGRSLHRYAWSWLRVRCGGRRSLGRPLPPRNGPSAGRVWVACDEHCPALRAGGVDGSAVIEFAFPVAVRTKRRLRVVRSLDGVGRRPGVMLDRIELGEGERVVIRP